MALGFGSVMFAFEGIAVVLPVYNRIKKREQFGSLCGVINVSFLVILVLDFIVGFLGYMKYGADTKDSITLNLPAEPLYDAVRAMFTISILLSYPLQFYVPNQIIWDWSKKNLIKKPTSWHPREITMDDTKDAASVQGLNAIAAPKSLEAVDNKEISVPHPVAALDATSLGRDNITFQGLTSVPNKGANDIMTRPFHKELTQQDSVSMSVNSQAELVNSSTSGSSTSDTSSENGDDIPLRYEYYCRLCLVLTTFTLAISVPKLNLLMDFIGSFSGVLLCLTVPAMIHMAAYWGTLRGFKKCSMIIIDSSIAILSLVAGFHGSFSSLMAIIGGYHPQLQ
jgi:amino acid permease